MRKAEGLFEFSPAPAAASSESGGDIGNNNCGNVNEYGKGSVPTNMHAAGLALLLVLTPSLPQPVKYLG